MHVLRHHGHAETRDARMPETADATRAPAMPVFREANAAKQPCKFRVKRRTEVLARSSAC